MCKISMGAVSQLDTGLIHLFIVFRREKGWAVILKSFISDPTVNMLTQQTCRKVLRLPFEEKETVTLHNL